MANSPIPIGEVFANKYRVESILGEGGMGIVVAAHHLELDQRVAVKFLLDDLAGSEEGAQRFRREARAAAKIQSDHVVRVLDVGILDSGERYMVMEYMDGRDLAEEIKERGKFPAGVAAGFILEAIDAVAHAHSVGIVHRDLKPANLFLARRSDGSQRIKVLDFGISKFVGQSTAPELSLTKTSAWIGSPLYMAPEQMQSARDVDARADIWSLGAILYELIAGRTPYEADSLPQLCNLLITTDPTPIQELCPEVPNGLAAAIMGCLTRDPTERTQNVLDLAAALSPYATSSAKSLRSSLLGRTNVAAPASFAEGHTTLSESTEGMDQPAAPTAGGAFKTDPTVRSARGVSGKTHAAWGGTEPSSSQKKSSSRFGLLALALVGALVVGFFAARGLGGGAQADEMSDLSPESDSAASPAQVEQDVAAPSEQAAAPEPALEVEEPKVEEPKVEEPKEAAAQPAKASAPSPRPRPRPRPQVHPRPRPAAAKPSPSPAPKDPPKAEPKDDFADFGGRR